MCGGNMHELQSRGTVWTIGIACTSREIIQAAACAVMDALVVSALRLPAGMYLVAAFYSPGIHENIPLHSTVALSRCAHFQSFQERGLFAALDTCAYVPCDPLVITSLDL